MQIKNKINIIIICLLNFLLFNLNLGAEEFDISAKEITIDNTNSPIRTEMMIDSFFTI